MSTDINLTRDDVREIRKTLKLSRKKFGDLMGYSGSYINMIETGAEDLTLSFADKVLKGLKSHIYDLEKMVQRIMEIPE
jgi:predicted transcriptional regulator